jgi:hypothetical protein
VVNQLLTIKIKVNRPASAESQLNAGVNEMKKVNTGRGLLDWILGGGTSGSGGKA